MCVCICRRRGGGMYLFNTCVRYKSQSRVGWRERVEITDRNRFDFRRIQRFYTT